MHDTVILQRRCRVTYIRLASMEWIQHGPVELPSDTLEFFREYSFAFDMPAAEGSEPGAAPAFASPFDRPSQQVRNARSNDLPAPLHELNNVPPLRRSSSLPTDLSFLKSLATLPGHRHDLAAPVAGCLPSSLNLTEYRDGLPASADLRMLPDKCIEPCLAAGVRQPSGDVGPQSSSSEAEKELERQPAYSAPRSKLLGAVYEACRSIHHPDAPTAAQLPQRQQLRSQALTVNTRTVKRQRTSQPHRGEAERSHSFSEFTTGQANSAETSPVEDQMNLAAGGVMKVEGRPMQISWARRSSPPPPRYSIHEPGQACRLGRQHGIYTQLMWPAQLCHAGSDCHFCIISSKLIKVSSIL